MKQPAANRFRNALGYARSSPLPFAVTCLLLAVLLGGGSRADIMSLVILRPLSVILLAIAILRFGRQAWASGKIPVGIALAVVLLAIVQVIPLPPNVWTALPGRGVLADVYSAMDAPLPWAPLSLSPSLAWNALFSLALPLATLLATLCLDKRDQRLIALVVVGLCVLSGLVSLLQIAGGSNSWLYFYRITNAGAAVGLFANRNHNALFMAMAFPILATLWNMAIAPDRLRLVRGLLLSTALMLLPMVLLTGSRGGLLVTAVGLATAAMIVLRGKSDTNPVAVKRRGVMQVSRTRLAVGVAIGIAVLATVVLLLIRSSAFERLLAADPSQELRLLALPTIWRQVTLFWPVGSGAGTFEYAYRQAEDLALVGPQYVNHAHNDWLEVLLTYGLPGAILMAVAVIAYVVRLSQLLSEFRLSFDRQTAISWAGAAMIGMIALLSIFDYPLRVPSVATVFAVAVVWMSRSRNST